MALLSKKEFADACGLGTNNLATYIGRKKVAVDKKGMVNTSIEPNKTFLQKRKARQSEKQAIAHIKKVGEGSNIAIDDLIDEYENDEGVPAYHISETKLKFLDTKKREQEIRFLETKNQKLKGLLVPTDLIEPVFLRHNHFILTEFKNATDEIIRLLAKKHDIPTGEIAKIKGEAITVINRAIEKAAESTAMAIESIVNDFSDKRGKGEKA